VKLKNYIEDYMQHIPSIQNDNKATLAAYQAKTQVYIDNTPLGDEHLLRWLNEVLELVPHKGTIFEIGSGLGRDAEYIRSRGFSITCSDAVPNFLEIVQSKGFATCSLNILTDDIQGQYDLVLANAVLPHFAPAEVSLILDKVHKALNKEGYFAFSLKEGSGAVWSDEKLGKPRYFHYWQLEPFKNLVARHGFKWISMSECYTSYNSLNWMLITIRKN
jgi:predicted TPR repeat methyltransferase